jgi:spermidine synthase
MCPPAERPVVVDQRQGVLGELALRRAGDHYEVIANGTFLMDTRDGRSERALVAEALRGTTESRLLLAGLGVGCSLREALDAGGASDVTVVELEPAIVEWAGTHLRPVVGDAMDDPRVRVVVGDLREQLGELEGPYDAVCLDVDNGPGWLVHERNAWLYEEAGLAALAGLLEPGGRLAVWSSDRDRAFEQRLRVRFAEVRTVEIPVARGPADVIYVAERPFGSGTRRVPDPDVPG